MNTTTLSSAVADAAGKAQKSQGLSAESFLMSLAVYERWEPRGISTEMLGRRGVRISAQSADRLD
ncbi:uncharacterized protein ATNIH1004_008858 [Aspergillus tanneri]|uniref:Uncharacterized protein n=1 Tax=Aspergillus tanneri TaxID=1220188 RepID=A0A5M9MCB0_9EURO|nr:uncharacterized protein ATNIH1004_008858 [Aspergillus tanneri]KAA8644652.1 hypothetical protein ATNIH1004_008858 [Aspergillus tanneri]